MSLSGDIPLVISVLSGAAYQLGTLPPPASLASLPVSTGAAPTWVNSQPISMPGLTHTPVTPISHGVPQSDLCQQRLNLPLIQQNTLLPVQSQQGIILSPAADPIPPALVQKIQACGFIEMRDLLADNVALMNQITSLGGTLSLPPSTMNCTRLCEVPSLIFWLYCFITYTAIRTSDPLTRDMLAYACHEIGEVLRHGGTGWMEYDRVFRRQLAIDSSIP